MQSPVVFAVPRGPNRPPSGQDRWDYTHEIRDAIDVQIRAAFELVAGLITLKEEDGPAL